MSGAATLGAPRPRARRFVDGAGVAWVVRDVVLRVERSPGPDARSRCVHALRFASAHGLRHVEPLPAGWRVLDAAALEHLCRAAIDPRRRRHLAPLV